MSFISYKENNMKTLTKYKNRKIYSTEIKRYVNLDEIYDMVKSGETVRVLTHKGADDVTSEVLKEAIMRYTEVPVEKFVELVRG